MLSLCFGLLLLLFIGILSKPLAHGFSLLFLSDRFLVLQLEISFLLGGILVIFCFFLVFLVYLFLLVFVQDCAFLVLVVELSFRCLHGCTERPRELAYLFVLVEQHDTHHLSQHLHQLVLRDVVWVLERIVDELIRLLDRDFIEDVIL